MIRLKDVSKFYYQNGMISSGFTKVNLELKIGEFVVITGESGSGKSTLLNVISGLDTYEEGEMYINGEETSHYTEVDFENYRRRYVGNIFQNFNLVNSYTVYQNIELALLLNGENKKDIQKQVLDIINTVGLKKFCKTKVSKLSGGQKQRVAIARALAKETPIIVADEPTGNLDSASAKQIMKLLSEISKDKLVIIVTHNKEQVEEYATRLIQMHDGKVLEDKTEKIISATENIEVKKYKDITVFNRFRLGLRNTFNIIPKFLLIFFVFLFITASLLFQYSSSKEREYSNSLAGNNFIFPNNDTRRIVIQKNDLSPITDSDLESLRKIGNVNQVVENDVLLDNNTLIADKDNRYWLNGNVNSFDLFAGELDLGRLPENDREVVVSASKYDWYFAQEAESILNTEFYIRSNSDTSIFDDTLKIKIVGIKYAKSFENNNVFYMKPYLIDQLKFQVNENYSKVRTLFNDRYYDSDFYNPSYHVVANKQVPKGMAYISSDLNPTCKNENCVNSPLLIQAENNYYREELSLKVGKTYTKKSLKSLTGLTNYDSVNGNIFINEEEYNQLFNKDTYQSSIFVKDIDIIDETVNDLQKAGYHTLVIKDTLAGQGEDSKQLTRMMNSIISVILIIALFFISYFVIKIILKSRNVYFTTIRILGSTKQIARQILSIELFFNSTLAFLLSLGFILLVKQNIISSAYISRLITFLTAREYLVLYLILIAMSQLIAARFARKLFKQSVIKTYGEGV